MTDYSLLGLFVIIVAWLIQLLSMRKEKKINLFFLILYCLGVAVLVYAGFVSGLTSLAIANLVSFVVAFWVLVKSVKK